MMRSIPKSLRLISVAVLWLSSTACISASIAPTIVVPPASQQLFLGENVELRVVATGSEPLSYQWFKDGVAVVGGDKPSLKLGAMSKAKEGVYSVAVSNAFGTTTSYVPQSTAIGWQSSMFLRFDGAVCAMGKNDHSQFGADFGAQSLVPKKIAEGAKAVGHRDKSSFFLSENNQLYMAGKEDLGVLKWYQAAQDRFCKILNNVVDPSCGDFNGFLLKADGWSMLWGDDKIPPLEKAINADAGDFYTWFYITESRQLYGFGNNQYGQLGRGTVSEEEKSPALIMKDVVDVAAGYWQILVLRKDGTLWTCGDNRYGQLGTGNFTDSSRPVQVAANVRSIATGGVTSAYISSDGKLWACGYLPASLVEPGNESEEFRNVPAWQEVDNDVATVSVKDGTFLYAKRNGTLWAFGRNDSGQLGLGDAVFRPRPVMLSESVSVSLPLQARIMAKETSLEIQRSSQFLRLEVGQLLHLPRPTARYIAYSESGKQSGNLGDYVTAKPAYLMRDQQVAAIRGDAIRGLRAGRTKLTLTYFDSWSVDYDVVVAARTNQPSVAKIELVNPPTSIGIAQTVNLQVRVTYGNGTSATNPAGLLVSVGESKAKVSGTRLTGAKAGPARLIASCGGKTAAWTFNVRSWSSESVHPFLRRPATGSKLRVPVIIINYIPTHDGIHVNQDWFPITDDSGEIVKNLRISDYKRWITANDIRTKFGIEEGSKFRGYQDSTATPYVGVQVLANFTFYDIPKRPTQSVDGSEGFRPDWKKIFAQIGMERLVNELGVKEVWFNQKSLAGDESNMSSPTTGDVSNSGKDETDLPIYNSTYVVYGNVTHRSYAENLHNRGHQYEAQLAHVDGQFFWEQFVGSIGNWRCGATHYTPNSERDYDYSNQNVVWSDVGDWTPFGTGVKQPVNLQTWTYPRLFTASVPKATQLRKWQKDTGKAMAGEDSQSGWLIYWFQSIPGEENGIRFGDKEITNWWDIIFKWDESVKGSKGLWRNTGV
jgi:alpha-tubulin suppressor-like RCC1 family protein